MPTDDPTLDELLAQLRDAEARGASEAQLNPLRGRIAPVNNRRIAARLASRHGGPGDDWIHLFSLRSIGSMQWCDAGFIYFLIRRSDRDARNFQNVVLSLCTS